MKDTHVNEQSLKTYTHPLPTWCPPNALDYNAHQSQPVLQEQQRQSRVLLHYFSKKEATECPGFLFFLKRTCINWFCSCHLTDSQKPRYLGSLVTYQHLLDVSNLNNRPCKTAPPCRLLLPEWKQLANDKWVRNRALNIWQWIMYG